MFDKMSRIEGSEVKEETEQYWTHISGSDLLASLLPGIVTMLVKIITEPNKVGLQLVFSAVFFKWEKSRHLF